MKSPRLILSFVSASVLAAPSLFAADAPAKKAPAAPVPASAIAPSPAEDALPPVVAVVEGKDIKGEELERTFNGFLASRQIPPGALPPAEKALGYHQILEEMIKEKLIENRSGDIKITDEEVADTFKKFTASMGSEEEVQKQLAASGQTMDKVRESIRSSLRQDRWLEAEMTKNGGVTDKDAEDFYKKNTDKFVSPPQVRASHILVKVAADAKPETVIEKEKVAQSIAARVKKGEDFAKLAKELSEDPTAKDNSGDLDFFGKDQMVPEFSTAAFAMKKGEISDPVRSSFGYHVIKLTDRKESETVPLEKVKPRVLAFLKGQKAESLKQDIRDKAKVEIKLPTPPPPAAAEGLPDPAGVAPVK